MADEDQTTPTDNDTDGAAPIESAPVESAPVESAPPEAAGETAALDLAQDEIASLLAQENAAQSDTPPSPHPVEKAGDDIQLLIRQAAEALQSGTTASEVDPAALYALPEFSGSKPTEEKATLELLRDVDLDLKIELGRTRMQLEDVLKLRQGSVVALDKLAGDPVDIYANGRLVARGEVLVMNDNFCIRVAELIAGQELK